MKIGDVMTRNVSFVSVGTTLREAAERMRSEDVGILPVVDPGTEKIAGMLTDRDIVVRAVAGGKDVARTVAGDAMTRRVSYVFEDEDLYVAAERMKTDMVRRLVVVDREKRLVGLLSLTDLARCGEAEVISAAVMRSVSEPEGPYTMH